MNFYKNKEVLVAGGTGMIGQPIVQQLVQLGAKVTIASLDGEERVPKGVKYEYLDLRSFENCIKVTKNKEIVFNLAGVKGSPKMTSERPASFMVPTIQFSFNLMEASRRNSVGSYLFTSSVGVYEPADVFYEDSVWQSFPSPNDRFAGWAKRICELQAEAYRLEYNWNNISIVRPANVYGPFDNFDPENAMVIPSLIYRALEEDGPLVVWGDGSPIRDFIHAKDVARGILKCVEKGIHEPVNLGSGNGFTIKEIAETIAKYTNKEIKWDSDKPSGDSKRIMDIERAKSYDIECSVPIEEGIKETIEWYKSNKDIAASRYNSFTEKELQPI